MKRCMFTVACVIALAGIATAATPSLTLGFQFEDDAGNPITKVSGSPGETKTFFAFPILTTAENAGEYGAQGWQIGFKVEGGTLTAATLKGVYVSLIYDEDVNQDGSLIVRHDPYEQHLFDSSMFSKGAFPAALATDPEVKGAIGWALFRSQELAVLQPNGVARMMKATITAAIPAEGTDCSAVKLTYIDQMKSTTSQPTDNSVTFNSVPVDFILNEDKGETEADLLKAVVGEIAVCPPRPEFHLSMVPAGAAANLAGDFVHETTGLVADGFATVPIEVVLTSVDLSDAPGSAGWVEGPQGWQIAGAVEGCMTLESPSLKGVIVNTIYDEDVNQDGSLIVHHDNYEQDLFASSMFSKGAYVATLDTDPSVKGFISWALFRSQEKMTLHPETSDVILRATLKIPVQLGVTTECRAYFQDKMKSTTSQPTDNNITYLGQPHDVYVTKTLNFHSLIIKATGIDVIPPANFKRGQINGDTKIDIADAVWIVFHVIQDPNYPLVCWAAGDIDPTGEVGVNFLDAVALIQYLFNAGAKPASPFDTCGIAGDTTETNCPPGSIVCY